LLLWIKEHFIYSFLEKKKKKKCYHTTGRAGDTFINS
jgi:hypothetical protein